MDNHEATQFLSAAALPCRPNILRAVLEAIQECLRHKRIKNLLLPGTDR